jgi:FkbM family methyltransferase
MNNNYSNGKKIMGAWFFVAKTYARIYGFIKDTFGIHIRGLGFVLRRVKCDAELDVMGKRLFFDHNLAEAYAYPLHGKWNEPETHRFFTNILAQLNITFIEVGANIGEILIDVATNPSCEKAVAFEPNPVAASVIAKNIEINALSNCVVIPKALGDKKSIQKMHFGSHSPTASLLSSESMSGLGIGVEVSTLDSEIDFDELKESNIALLVDVEGYEPNVLRGGRELIYKLRPLIVFEYNSESKKYFSLDEIRNILGGHYSIYRIRKDAMLDNDVDNAWNCVAIPENSKFGSILKSQICVD